MTIKISELGQISSANLLANTTAIIPVVSGNASLETLRTDLSSLTDYIFSTTVTTSNLSLGNTAGTVNRTNPGTTNQKITVRPSMDIQGSGLVNALDYLAMSKMLDNDPTSAGRVINYPNTPFVIQHETKKATGLMLMNCSVYSEATNDYVSPGVMYLTAGNTTNIFTYVRIGNDPLEPGDVKIKGQFVNISGNVYSSNIQVYSTTPTTGPYDGALIVNGGTGVGGNLAVAGIGSFSSNILVLGSAINANNILLSGNAIIGNANVRSNITVGNLTVRSNATVANASIGNLTVTTIGIHEWATAKTLVVGPQIDYIDSTTVGAGSPSPYEYSQCYIDTTGGALTPSLTDGADEGFIKIFYMYFDGGNCTLTVDSAAWKGGPSMSGTITFNDVGDTCTLMWNLGSWYILSSYGVTIA